jgi:hypothetical protein
VLCLNGTKTKRARFQTLILDALGDIRARLMKSTVADLELAPVVEILTACSASAVENAIDPAGNVGLRRDPDTSNSGARAIRRDPNSSHSAHADIIIDGVDDLHRGSAHLYEDSPVPGFDVRAPDVESRLRAAVETSVSSVLRLASASVDYGDGTTVPDWAKEGLKFRHQQLLRGVASDRSSETTYHQPSLVVGMPAIVTRVCERTGRLPRPDVLSYVSSGRGGLILDWSILRRWLASDGLWPLRCPFQTSTGPRHTTAVVNGKVQFKFLLSTKPLADFVLVAVSECPTCKLQFNHAHPKVLATLPRSHLFSIGLSLDCNNRDVGILLSESLVQQERINRRMRQGGTNWADKITELVGHEAVQRRYVYIEDCARHVIWLYRNVSDEIWFLLSFEKRTSLLGARAEWLSFSTRGALFRAWPDDPHIALASPKLNR